MRRVRRGILMDTSRKDRLWHGLFPRYSVYSDTALSLGWVASPILLLGGLGLYLSLGRTFSGLSFVGGTRPEGRALRLFAPYSTIWLGIK